jgi:hypothetical protein
MRTLDAAVRELKRNDPVMWGTQMRATAPAESPCGNKPNLRQTLLLDMRMCTAEVSLHDCEHMPVRRMNVM